MTLEDSTLHPAWIYMLYDIGGSVWGSVVFVLALAVPGYAVARWMDARFVTRGLREQLAWSIALSFGVGTVAIVGCVWATGTAATGWILAFIGCVAAVAIWRRPPRFDISRKGMLLCTIVAALWGALVIFSLMDAGITDRLSMSVVSYDHSVRAPFVGAVMRTGVPPTNPLYWPGHPAPMRYYYFWYVTCGVVARLAHISARQALVAGCIWQLAGVGAVLALFGRYLLGWRGKRLTQSWRLAMLLLAITGLDLLANLGAHAGGDALYGDMEWWSVDQITSWADTFLWVPHHAASMISCLLCALLLWRCYEGAEETPLWKMACIAGLCFASAFGLSTYVAMGVALLLAIWVMERLLRGDRRRILLAAAIASAVAILVLSPYLMQLLHKEADQASGRAGSVLGFGVRRMLDPNMLNDAIGFRSLRLHHPLLETNLAALLLLLPGYITELGFFAIVLIVASRRKTDRSAGERTLLFWTWAGLAAVTFIRSQVLVTNDYGYRAVLLPQFFLLLLGAVVLSSEHSPWLRRALFATAGVGLLGTVYQLTVLRMFLPWHEAHGDPAMAQLAEQNYALRDAFSGLDRMVPQEARVQYDPANGYLMFTRMLQSNRQVVNGDPGCLTNFGGEVAPCAQIQRAVEALYRNSSAPGVDAIEWCQSIGVHYLIATRWDAVWKQPQSWVWTLPATLERPNVRVMACGKVH